MPTISYWYKKRVGYMKLASNINSFSSIVFILIFFSWKSACADTIYLHSGEKIEGVLVGANASTIYIRSKGGILNHEKSQIKSISFNRREYDKSKNVLEKKEISLKGSHMIFKTGVDKKEYYQSQDEIQATLLRPLMTKNSRNILAGSKINGVITSSEVNPQQKTILFKSIEVEGIVYPLESISYKLLSIVETAVNQAGDGVYKKEAKKKGANSRVLMMDGDKVFIPNNVSLLARF